MITVRTSPILMLGLVLHTLLARPLPAWRGNSSNSEWNNDAIGQEVWDGCSEHDDGNASSENAFSAVVQDAASDENPANIEYKRQLLESKEEKSNIVWHFYRYKNLSHGHAGNLVYAGLKNFPPSKCWMLSSEKVEEYGPAFDELYLLGKEGLKRERRGQRGRSSSKE